jgi:hypothetical protein
MIEEGERNFLRKTAHLPQRLAAVKPERAKGVRARKRLKACARNAAPPPQIAHIAVPRFFVMPAKAGIQ